MHFFRIFGINSRGGPFLSLVMVLCHCSEESYLVLTVKDNVYTCITNSSSALVNNERPAESFVATFQDEANNIFDCDISNNSPCDGKWTPHLLESAEAGNWGRIESTSQTKIDQLILDYRWERFPTLILRYEESPRNFKKLLPVEGDDFVIPMSIRVKYNVDLYLCKGTEITASKCFGFMLMGLGSVTILRKHDFDFEKSEEVLKEEVHPNISQHSNELHWNHILLTKKDNKVIFSSENGIIISEFEYKDSFVKTSGKYHLFGRARQKNLMTTYFKIHSYTFTRTEQTQSMMPFGTIKSSDGFYCISMFILTCEGCFLTCKFDGPNNGYESHLMNRSSSEPYRWSYEKFIFNSNSPELRLYIGALGKDEGIWAIDSIQECQMDEIRSISRNNLNLSCETLKDMEPVKMTKETNVIDELDTSNWSRSLEGKITTNSTICVAGYCYCRYGYHGDFCKEKIKPSIYSDRPEIIAHDATSCTIRQQMTLPQSGPIQRHYLVQYKNRTTEDWTTHTIGNLIRGQEFIEISMIELRNNELYVIRVVPYGSQFEVDHLINNGYHEIECTPCSEPSMEDLTYILPTVESSNDSALVTFTGEKYCTMEAEISIRCSNYWCRQDEAITKHTTSKDECRFTSLQPFSKYSLNYTLSYKKNRKTFLRSFTTYATVSKPITELETISRGDNYISLRWRPPYPPTGILKSYRFLDAATGKVLLEKEVEVCRLWKEYHCIKLTNLNKNTSYSIQVAAINDGQKESEYRNISCYTAEKESEQPLDLKSKWKDTGLTLSWRHPNNTNGVLTSFIIKLTMNTRKKIQEQYMLKSEDDYKLDYEYKICSELEPSTEFGIEVIPKNKINGLSARLDESTPPGCPEINAMIGNVTNSSLSVELFPRKLEQNTKDETLHLFFIVGIAGIIFWNDSKINISASTYKRLHNNCTLAAYQRYEGINMSSDVIDLGTSSHPIINVSWKPYETVGEDIVCVSHQGIILLAVNEYRGKYRHYMIRLGMKHSVPAGIKLYWLFLFLLFSFFPLVVGISRKCYRSFKTKKRTSLHDYGN